MSPSRTQMLLLVSVLVLIALCRASLAAAPVELAALVPGDAGSYTEIDLDRALCKSPDTADLRRMLSNMQSINIIRAVLDEDPEAQRALDGFLACAAEVSEAIGPHLGIAFWSPDTLDLLGDMTSASPADELAGLKVLVLAQVRDDAAAEALLSRALRALEIELQPAGLHASGIVMSTPDGFLSLARGDGWLVLSHPGEPAKAAADLAAGAAAAGSLWRSADYRSVMRRLPDDATVTFHSSRETMTRSLALLTLLNPELQLPAPTTGVGMAMGVRLEGEGSRKLATAYISADAEIVPMLADTQVGLGAAMVYPVFLRARSSARKAVCLSNMKNLTLAAMMYEIDYGHFPSADRWTHELADYMKNETVLHCPEDMSGSAASYAINAAVAGKPYAAIADPERVVLFYETDRGGANPSGGPQDVVAVPRHLGGNNYGFVDGRAVWLETVPSFGPDEPTH